MTRAEEKSIVYQLATHGLRVMGGSAILSEDDYKFWNINYDFKAGYEEGEKDMAERAIAWLKEHANDYIVDLTPTYPDAPFKAKIGGKCWDDLIKAMEEE